MRTYDRIYELLLLAGEHGATSSRIINVCHAWSGAAYSALYRMEKAGAVVSAFDDGPYPRSCRYWIKGFEPGARR